MNATIYVIFKDHFDFALEVWFSIYKSVLTEQQTYSNSLANVTQCLIE